jgi:hypothetical protein
MAFSAVEVVLGRLEKGSFFRSESGSVLHYHDELASIAPQQALHTSTASLGVRQ